MFSNKSILIIVLAILFALPFFKGSFSEPNNAYGSSTGSFSTYDEAVKGDKPAIILFYTDWCTYCKRFIPKFNSVAASNSDKFSFVKINIEKPQRNVELANKYKIRGIPTVYVVDKKYNVKRELSPYSQESVATFQNELNKYLKQRR